MLLSSKAWAEAMRALVLQTSLYQDMTHVTEGEEQEKYQSYLNVLTPVCKAWASDWGVQVALWCLQVYGGYGYTSEFPAEQYVRDAEIAPIYEGTNGIQALDFVARKMPLRGGKAIQELMLMAAATWEKTKDDPELEGAAKQLLTALEQIQTVSTELMKHPDGMELTLINAVPITDMVGNILGAHYLLDQAHLAKTKMADLLAETGVSREDNDAYRKLLAENDEAAFLHNKVQTAIHFAFRALPLVTARATAVLAGERAMNEAYM
jgi:hypothetical protein